MKFDLTILFPAAFLTWLIVTILWSLISLHHGRIDLQKVTREPEPHTSAKIR